MRRFVYIFFGITTLSSCTTNIGGGIIAGGALGAGIGDVSGGGGKTLIGSATGILTGWIVGAVLDQQDRKIMEQSSPRTVNRMDRGDPLTISDVIKLSQSGVSDEAIITYLRDTKSTYHLSQTQIHRLRDAGVSQRVIHYMAEPTYTQTH